MTFAMGILCTLTLLIVFSTENIETSKVDTSKVKNMSKDNFPLTRSLGFSLDSKAGKKLDDAMFNQGYLEQYQEVMRASRESFESFERDKERRRRRGKSAGEPVGDAVFARRRGAGRLRSEFGRRRARSQAQRRDKLHNQSVKSHLEHSKVSKSSPVERPTDTSEAA